jgi:hemoglobin
LHNNKEILRNNEEIRRLLVGDKMSLYDQLGGEGTISQVVADFYDRVSTHEVTSKWFVKVDPDTLRHHLRTYLAVALGGPELYSGRSMRNAHGPLKITTEAFDTMLRCFAEAFDELGVPATMSTQVNARLNSLRAVVVTSHRA